MNEIQDKWGDLMALAQGGDEEAYSQLLNQLYPVIQRFLMSKLGPFGQGEDVVQECIIAIHKARHTYDSARPFQPWLFSVVKYKAIDMLRKKQRQWSRETADEKTLATIEAPQSNNSIEEEQAELIHKAIAALPDEMRRAVQLTKIEGLDTQTASEREKISPVALRSRVSRAYKLMRKTLEKDFASSK